MMKGDFGGVKVYTDASYLTDLGTQRSHTGAVVMLGGTPICWRSHRQSFVTQSTAEAELMAATTGHQMMMSVIEAIAELGIHMVGEIGIDNQAAITLTTEAPTHWRTRHLRMRGACIQEGVNFGHVVVGYVPGKKQVADYLTKPLSPILHEACSQYCSMHDFGNYVPELEILKTIGE